MSTYPKKILSGKEWESAKILYKDRVKVARENLQSAEVERQRCLGSGKARLIPRARELEQEIEVLKEAEELARIEYDTWCYDALLELSENRETVLGTLDKAIDTDLKKILRLLNQLFALCDDYMSNQRELREVQNVISQGVKMGLSDIRVNPSGYTGLGNRSIGASNPQEAQSELMRFLVSRYIVRAQGKGKLSLDEFRGYA